MSRTVIKTVRFTPRQLEQLRAAVVSQLRAEAAPAVRVDRMLGPAIREAALAWAREQLDADGRRNTGGEARARGDERLVDPGSTRPARRNTEGA